MEEQYAAYCYEFSYPPTQPGHLIAFAKKNGVKVTWAECKNIIKKAPDTSDYVPPPKKDENGKTINDPPKPKKTEQEMKDEKMETAKRYSNNKINIDHQKLVGINKRSSAARYQYLITQLTSMGWDHDQSLAALKESNGNLQLAMEALMSGNLQHHTVKVNKATNNQVQHQQPESKQNVYNQPVTVEQQQQDFIYNLQQNQPPLQPPADSVNDAFSKLLGGHGSIKQRLRSMDEICANLDGLDISSDNGKVLLSVFAEQILHEDHIYHDYAVRIKALKQMADVFIFCLNKTNYQKIPDLINNSFAEILDNLYKLIDDNRCRKFHKMAKQCADKMIDAVIGKNHKIAIIDLCGILNEKINCENIHQAHSRFFAAKQIFQKLIFGNNDIKIINDMFNIDINAFNNKLEKHTNGININQQSDLPDNRQWIDLLIADSWNDNDDETFKDIISDCLSIMIIDPNPDLSVIALNLQVYFNALNNNFKNYLETEAKHRFSKYLVVDNNNNNTETMQSEPEQPIQAEQQQNKYQLFKQQHSGEKEFYQIKQQTEVNVSAPTLPSI